MFYIEISVFAICYVIFSKQLGHCTMYLDGIIVRAVHGFLALCRYEYFKIITYRKSFTAIEYKSFLFILYCIVHFFQGNSMLEISNFSSLDENF